MTRAAILSLVITMSVLATGWQQPIDPTAQRIVDLSHAFGPRTLYWPTSPTNRPGPAKAGHYLRF